MINKLIQLVVETGFLTGMPFKAILQAYALTESTHV